MTDLERPIRVLTVDDDSLVRGAYRTFFSSQSSLALAGEARDGREAVELYDRVLPDVVLMDLQMPHVNGIEATEQICKAHPDACIVVLTTFGTKEHVVAALRAGAAGYLLKDTRPENLLTGIQAAMAGDMPLSAAIRRQLVASVAAEPARPQPTDVGLTPRETELLGWLAQGLTNSQIARQMYLSEGSVKQYLGHIGAKLGVRSRTQILVRSIQLDLVRPEALPPIRS